MPWQPGQPVCIQIVLPSASASGIPMQGLSFFGVPWFEAAAGVLLQATPGGSVQRGWWRRSGRGHGGCGWLRRFLCLLRLLRYLRHWSGRGLRGCGWLRRFLCLLRLLRYLRHWSFGSCRLWSLLFCLLRLFLFLGCRRPRAHEHKAQRHGGKKPHASSRRQGSSCQPLPSPSAPLLWEGEEMKGASNHDGR